MPDIIRFPRRRPKRERTRHDGPATIQFNTPEEPGWRDEFVLTEREISRVAISGLGLLVRRNSYTGEMYAVCWDVGGDARFAVRQERGAL